MSNAEVRDTDVRLWIYQHFAATGLTPSPVEIAAHFGFRPDQAGQVLHRLQNTGALVLMGWKTEAEIVEE